MGSVLASLVEGLNILEYSDWVTFVERLKEAVQSGRVREIPVAKPVWGGKSEQWFLETDGGEIYFYVPPNPPVLPRWEKVDILGQLGAPELPPLSVFKTGKISVMTAHIRKLEIEALVGRGLVEELPTPASVPASNDGGERWYRDLVSNVVYRLIEYYPLKGADDIRWEVVPQAELGGRIQ